MATPLRRCSTSTRRQVSAVTLGGALLLCAIGCKAVADNPGVSPRQPLLQIAANGGTAPRVPISTGDVLLRVDFEDATVVPPPNRSQQQVDVLKLRLPSGAPADIGIFYEGGKPADRYAQVVPDPAGGNNRVLKFWLKDAGVAGQRAGKKKGRIQMALPNLNFPEAYQRYRMYLHPDLARYQAYPEQSFWFTINELWFGAGWKGHPHPFRITLGIAKERGAGQPLHFLATADAGVGRVGKNDKWSPVWNSFNTDYAIPIGEWLDVELGYRQGDSRTGRFYLAVKRESETAMTTIMDVHNWTYNPQSRTPVPLTNWNPLKIYTSQAIIDFIRQQGGVAQLYFDDLELRRSWPR